jgi:hypothetical protein
MRDKGSGATLSMAVPNKGEGSIGVPQRCAKWVDNLGYQRVTLKTDQEPSIRAWARAVARHREADTVPESSPVGDSQSSGVAEQAVGEVKKIIATLKHALATNIKSDVEPRHAVMTWLVEYAGVLTTRHKVKPDGRTGFEAIRGKRASLPICGFGEKFLYQPSKIVPNRKVDYGIYLGVLQASNEILVATADGVVKVRTIKILPEYRRRDADSVLGVKGTPWAAIDGATSAPVPVAIHMPIFAGNMPPAVDHDPAPQLRVMRIMNADYDEHGYREGCRGCSAMRRSAQAIPHTLACRSRMEAALAATAAAADIVRQSAGRMGAHVAGAIERADGEHSSKRQKIAAEGGSTGDIANPSIPMDESSASAALRSAAQIRPRSAEDDKDEQPDDNTIKGQQPTGTGGQQPTCTVTCTGTRTTDDDKMEDTMDRPNDPGAASSRNPIIIVSYIPTIPADTPQVRKVPTMPTRAGRNIQKDKKDVDVAVISRGPRCQYCVALLAMGDKKDVDIQPRPAVPLLRCVACDERWRSSRAPETGRGGGVFSTPRHRCRGQAQSPAGLESRPNYGRYERCTVGL